MYANLLVIIGLHMKHVSYLMTYLARVTHKYNQNCGCGLWGEGFSKVVLRVRIRMICKCPIWIRVKSLIRRQIRIIVKKQGDFVCENSGAEKAQNEAMEGCGRPQWSLSGSKWRVCKPVVAEFSISLRWASPDRILRIKVIIRIRIRIKVKSWKSRIGSALK